MKAEVFSVSGESLAENSPAIRAVKLRIDTEATDNY
jgi:hypothetical protein